MLAVEVGSNGGELLLSGQIGDARLKIVIGEFQPLGFAPIASRAVISGEDMEALQLVAKEELAAIRPDLDGQQIMAILGIKPGPEVGKAYKFLLNLRLDEGPHTPDEAKNALLAWWATQDR